MGVHCKRSSGMLFFLALFSSALAAPQYFPYFPYHHPYSAYPAYQPSPLLYYSQQRADNNVMGRNLIKFGNFLEINGEFMADTTTTPARTISGTINIQQNGLLDVVTGNDAKFTLYIQSTVDLNGKELKVQLATGTAPPSINGFYITGTTTGHNIDGMNSKMALRSATNWLVLTESGTVIGCSKAALQ